MTTARFNLPEVHFAEKSAEQIEQDILNRYEQLTGVQLSVADPRRKLIQSLLPILVQQRSLIDYGAKSNLLSYAFGGYLDHIGLFVDSERVEGNAARTTIRFYLSVERPEDILIPAGIRIGHDKSDVIFFTSHVAHIEKGSLTVDIVCECQDIGQVGNDITPGELNRLIDPLPWIEKVENITKSEGGANRESDESYAERIRLSPEKFSVAGPTGAYEYWAKTASSLITDVEVYSPRPCVVKIIPLLQNGQIPGQEILDKVFEVCNDKTRRPLTDQVEVDTPTVIYFDIEMTYWVDSKNAINIEVIKNNVEQAIQDYVLWQKTKLGRDINSSELIMRVMNAGAKRVNVINPSHQEVEKSEIAFANSITINFGGIEDD